MSVFLVHHVKELDLSPALVYGELHTVNSRYVYADELENDRIPASFLMPLVKAAHAFNPAKDYLLIAGDHLQLVAMASALARVHQEYRVLRYDRQAKGYLSITIGV